ncbi:MAG: N-acetylmuramoyl-L-alanine amidase [Lachnospiraceae bacterium]|nr:N-acetylmuramoyl-L-alanine amidase [Lachnospiraceae bacterium]
MNRVCKIWAVLAAAGFLLVSGGCGGNTAISPVRESTAPVPEEAAAGITAAAFVNERNAADSGVEEPSSDSGDTADMGEENTPISLVVELDPGHGGVQSGAERAQDGILEKELNLKIAEYLKKELESYDNVTVYLTREGDEDRELEDRVKKAAEDGADVFISLHNNAAGDITEYKNGCTVLVPRGVYGKEWSLESQELAVCVLRELEKLGIENQGLLFRAAQNGEVYPNGELLDYYSVIRNSILYQLPGILIEHCFMDNDSDYDNFLSDDTKLEELARADARGIAVYYGLSRNGICESEKLTPCEEKVTLITTDHYQDNEYFTKTFFK